MFVCEGGLEWAQVACKQSSEWVFFFFFVYGIQKLRRERQICRLLDGNGIAIPNELESAERREREEEERKKVVSLRFFSFSLCLCLSQFVSLRLSLQAWR